MAFKIYIPDLEDYIEAEIKAGRTQRDIAQIYALAIINTKPADWERINKAILKKWKPSGLERIKKWAWDIVVPS